MKKYGLIILLSLILTSAQGQKKGISVTGGIGTYDLRELKIYQDDLLARMPVAVKGLSYFPPFSNFKISLFEQTYEGLKYGLTYSYSTTGAHANYKDYSGSLNLDQTLAAYQLGVTGSYRLLHMNYFELMAYGDLRFSYLRNKVNMNVKTMYYYENNSLALSTVSLFAEAGIEALYHFKNLSIGVEGGYLYDIGTKFKEGDELSEFPSVSLKPTNDIRSQMSGFRIGLKLIFWFNNEIKEGT